MEDKKVKPKKGDANSIIKNHMIWSMGAGFIPVPIADFFAVSAIQLDMIRQMCKLYEIDFKETEGKAMISALTGSGLARMGAKAAIKFIPGLGSVLGGVTMAVLSGGSTYALGEVFKKHFETGGTFLDFDPTRLKKYYDEKFEKGQDLARSLKNKQESEQELIKDQKVQAKKLEPIEKLKELAQMKKDGLITDEEFEKMKKKVIDA